MGSFMIKFIPLLVCAFFTANVAQAQTPARPSRPAAQPAPAIPTTPPAAPQTPAATRPPPTPPAAMPDMPPAPPGLPVIPPPPAVPLRPAPPATPPLVATDAPGAASKLADGLRVTFGADRSELNPASEAALRALVRAAAPDARFSLVASATGKADDSSAIRRLSLSRGLNVRAVLINEGVVSTRILLRALAAPPAGEEPPDRVDIAVQPARP